MFARARIGGECVYLLKLVCSFFCVVWQFSLLIVPIHMYLKTGVGSVHF